MKLPFRRRKQYDELIEDLYWSNILKIKTYWWICLLHTRIFLFHKMLIDGLELRGLLVDYGDVFINCLDSYSDILHCRGSMGE